MNPDNSIENAAGWLHSRLSDIADIKGGRRVPAGKSFADGQTPYPYLRVVDMINGSIDKSNIRYVSSEIEQQIRSYKISSNDLYVTIAGTIGNFGKIPNYFDNAQLTENAAKITNIDFKRVDKDFLYYSLSSDQITSQINTEIGQGGGVPKLALFRVAKLSLCYPSSLPKQKKIASILTTADNLIEKTAALIKKYQAINQGMMHDLFTRGIDENGELRATYESAPHLYKESELGWIPKEWKLKTLRDIGNWSGGITPSKSNSSFWQDGTIFWVSPKDVKGVEIKNTENKITMKALNNCRLRLYSPGSILIVVRSGILKHTFPVARCLSSFTVNQDMKVFDGGDSIRNEFCFWYLKSIEQHVLRKIVKAGTTVESVDTSTFFALPTPFPRKSEQVFLIEKLNSLERLILSNSRSLSKLRELKQSLMQDILTGKVRVPLIEEERKAS